MRILALDQSLLSCGFAIWETGWAKPQCGIWPLADGLRWAGRGFVRLQREIMAFHQAESLDHIVYEEPILVRADKVDKLVGLYGLVAHVMSFSAATGVPYDSVPAARWRKHFLPPTPRDVDWKFEAMKRCRELGFEPEKHDAAEAVGILDWKLHALGVQPPWAKAGALL